MISAKNKIIIFVSLIACLLLPAVVKAQATYGCGSYQSGSYSANCPVAQPAATQDTTANAGDTLVIDIKANDQVLTATTGDSDDIPEFTLGEPIVFSGTTIPFAEVHLYFQSEPFEAVVFADANGHWSYTLTKDLGEGTHTVQIAVLNPDTHTLSTKTTPKSFVLESAEKAATPQTTEQTKTPDYLWVYILIGVSAVVVCLVVWIAIVKSKKTGTKL